MINVLVFSRDAEWFGGVVNFIALLKKNFSNDIAYNQFKVGRRKGVWGLLSKPVVPLLDVIRLLRLLFFRKFDAYHLNPSLNVSSLIRDGLFLLVLRLMGASNVIVSFHGWDLSVQHKISQSSFFTKVFLWVFGYADQTLVLAQDFKKWLVDIGFDEKLVHLFTTMFDDEEFSKASKVTENDKVRILFLSRLVREKGIYELLDAFSELIKTYPNIRLVIAGNGPEEQNLRKIIDEHSLGKFVDMPGYLRDAAKVKSFYETDLFVFPTYYGEGCPVSLLEAMAAGNAIITTPVGGIPHIIKDNINGILIDKVNVHAIESAIRKLLDNKSLREYMSDNNNKDAWNKYKAPVVTQYFEEFYRGNVK